MTNINDAPILDQLEGQWQKFAAIILWKLNGCKAVCISAADIEDFNVAFEDGSPVIFTHGQKESICFQIVSEVRAKEIAAFQAGAKGTA